MPRLPPVALFRAREDAVASSEALAARGVAAALAPVVEILATGAAPPAGPFDFAIAASAKAIRFATPDILAAAGGLPLYAVGERTATAARLAGLAAQTPVAAEVAALLPTLAALSGRALLLAGEDRKPEIEATLAGRVAVVTVYEARARAGWDEAEAQAVAAAAAALHYSERSAGLAAELAETAGLAAAFRRLPHICLSRQVAAPLAAFGASRVLWPRAPSEEALFDTLKSALADYGGF